jgi:hypothetical protein
MAQEVTSVRGGIRLSLGLALFVAAFFAIALCSVAIGLNSEDYGYENYLSFKVCPDESVIMTVKGSYSDLIDHLEGMPPPIEGFDMNLELSTVNEDLTEVDGDFSVQLNPTRFSALANLDLELTGHSDKTSMNLTISINYPGYVGVIGDLGIVVVEPPFGLSVDLNMEAKLYYAVYPRESIEEIVETLPMLETQLAALIVEASDGHIALRELELLSSEMGSDSAMFNFKLSLTGDFQQGIQSLAKSMGVELTEEELQVDEIPFCEFESYDFHISFEKERLTLEADTGGTIRGDLDAQMNAIKDASLEQILESEDLDVHDMQMIEDFWLPTEFSVVDTLLEFSYSLHDEEVRVDFTLEDLWLKPPSLESLLAFLGELSEEEPAEDFKLILEGESSGRNYVAVNIPAETSEPLSAEPQIAVWDFAEIENLDEVTFEVKTESQPVNMTTTVAVAVVGLAIIGAAGYMFMRRK